MTSIILSLILLTLPPPNVSAPAATSPTPDAGQALEAVLAATDENRNEAFAGFIAAVDQAAEGAGISVVVHPKWRAATAEHPTEDSERTQLFYEDAQIEWRERWYGPVRRDSDCRDLLRKLAQDPKLESDAAPLACLILADAPSPLDITMMVEGYRQLESHHIHRISRARNIGWALTRLPESEDPEGEIRKLVYTLFRTHMKTPCGFMRGCALDGLFHSGLATEAVDGLRTIMNSDVPPKEILEAVAASAQLLKVKPVDTALVAKAVSLARATAEESLLDAKDDRSLAMTLGPAAMKLRNSIHILCEVEPASQVEFFLRFYRSPNFAHMLGLDGINDLGLALQRIRLTASEDIARPIDKELHGFLMETGERLWHLEEEPMTHGEYLEYYGDRDLRFTAAMYFSDLWSQTPTLQEFLLEDPDTFEFLTTLARSNRLESEGKGEDQLYFHVRDKVETQVLCISLLASMARDGDLECDLDLFAMLLELLAEEVDGDAEGALTLWHQQKNGAPPQEPLTISVVSEPEDKWVQFRIFRALTDMGATVIQKEQTIQIKLPEVISGS